MAVDMQRDHGLMILKIISVIKGAADEIADPALLR